MIEKKQCSCTRTDFGELPDGRKADLFSLVNSRGTSVTVTTYGASVVSIVVPDRNGSMGDIALGFESLEGYLRKENPFLGSTIGRYGNRIARGRFALNGRTYSLAVNNGVNHLHGGPGGFDKVLWHASGVKEDIPEVTMSYLSPDGEEGYPGSLEVSVTFRLTGNDELKIGYHAVTDADTVINLTNHTYFNLSGRGDILDHLLRIDASEFTPVDETSIPTGEIRKVTGTPFDFTLPAAIGARIDDTSDEQIRNGSGYDHNYVFPEHDMSIPVASAFSPETGRLLEVFTSEPGMQFYSGNFLDGTLTGKNNTVYRRRTGFCLETQHFPDSPNQPSFPPTLLRANERFESTTVYRFSCAECIK